MQLTTESQPSETSLEILEIKPEESIPTPQEFNYVVSTGSTKIMVQMKKPLSSQQDLTALVQQAQEEGNTMTADSLIKLIRRNEESLYRQLTTLVKDVIEVARAVTYSNESQMEVFRLTQTTETKWTQLQGEFFMTREQIQLELCREVEPATIIEQFGIKALCVPEAVDTMPSTSTSEVSRLPPSPPSPSTGKPTTLLLMLLKS